MTLFLAAPVLAAASVSAGAAERPTLKEGERAGVLACRQTHTYGTKAWGDCVDAAIDDPKEYSRKLNEYVDKEITVDRLREIMDRVEMRGAIHEEGARTRATVTCLLNARTSFGASLCER